MQIKPRERKKFSEKLEKRITWFGQQMRNLNTFNVFTMNQNKKDEHHEPSADKWVPDVSGTPFSHLFFL